MLPGFKKKKTFDRGNTSIGLYTGAGSYGQDHKCRKVELALRLKSWKTCMFRSQAEEVGSQLKGIITGRSRDRGVRSPADVKGS